MSTSRSRLIIGLAALLLLAPTLVLGTHLTHSSPQNLTWAAQFSEQFRAGVPYPRWTPQSFEGLGGPAFYFYPPLAFWIDAMVSVATGNLLSLSYRLAVSSTLILFASGLAMQAWLKVETRNPRVALWGSIAYMAAPYHLFDHYIRGAMAEFTAYAALPVVVLGIRLIGDGRRSGPATLALGYAALVLSHLPTALLASCTIIPAYVLFRARHVATFLRCAAAGSLGLGLAAIYLVPAMALQEWIAADAWWVLYRPQDWLLFNPGRWIEPHHMSLMAGLAAGGTLILASLGALWTRLPVGDPGRSELALWIVVSLGCLALMGGAVPWFWQIDLMAKVQFPWRMMSIVEFAIITAICVAPLDRLGRAGRYILVAAAVLIASTAAIIGAQTVTRFGMTLAGAPLDQRDMKPHQPRGFPQNPNTAYDELGLEPLANQPAVACRPAAQTCLAQDRRFGDMQIEIASDVPVAVSLRRFFFPAWQLEPALPLIATDPFRLVSFTAPAGNHSYRLTRRVLPAELWSWMVSGLSLVLLLAWVASTKWAMRRTESAQSTLR